MKKAFSLLFTLVLLLASSNAYARNAYQQYWKPGLYSVPVTEEDAQKYDELFEKALQMSESTSVREGFDAQSLEGAYELYLYMLEDGPFPEVYFDDLGTYIYSCGFPDESAISQQDAFYIACWYNAYVSSVPVQLLTIYGRGCEKGAPALTWIYHGD